MDKVLDTIELSKFKTYHEFMRALILEGISGYHFTLDQLNHQLYTLNKEIYEDLCEAAIGYLEMHAPAKIKSFEN